MAKIIKKIFATSNNSSSKTKSNKNWLNEFVEDYVNHFDVSNLRF